VRVDRDAPCQSRPCRPRHRRAIFEETLDP
jgi:hypothetical protein